MSNGNKPKKKKLNIEIDEETAQEASSNFTPKPLGIIRGKFS